MHVDPQALLVDVITGETGGNFEPSVNRSIDFVGRARFPARRLGRT